MARATHSVHAFPVRAVAFWLDEETDCHILIAAEREDGSGRRLEVQVGPATDTQKRGLGPDTYCLCDDTGATIYCGVTRWFEERGAVVVELTEDAAQKLGVGAYRLTIASPDARETVRRGLLELVGPNRPS